MARNPSRIDAKRGDRFLQADFTGLIPTWKPDSLRLADNLPGILLFYVFGLATKPRTTPVASVKEPVTEPPKAAAKCTDVITWLSLALPRFCSPRAT